MMSGIKDKKKKNDNNKSSEHLQNAKFVVRQESDIIIKKTIQSETKNDNEKNSDHEFSENDVVDYATLVEKKRARNRNLKIKRKYQILLKKNKRLQIFIRENEIQTSTKCKRNVISMSDDSSDEIFQLKRQRSIVELKSANLNLYYDKNYKEFKN